MGPYGLLEFAVPSFSFFNAVECICLPAPSTTALLCHLTVLPPSLSLSLFVRLSSLARAVRCLAGPKIVPLFLSVCLAALP